MKNIIFTLFTVLTALPAMAAQDALIAGDTWGVTRGKINANDTELYARPTIPAGADTQILQYSGTSLVATSSLDGIGSISLGSILDYKVGTGQLFDDSIIGTSSGWTSDKINDSINASAGYTATVPTYSDDPCTVGQYSWDTATNYDYRCEAANTWNYRDNNGLWVNWLNPAPSFCVGTELVCEDFEGVGTPTDWTVIAGTPDFDYVTSPAPLAGTESLAIAALDEEAGSPIFAAQTEVYAGFVFNSGALDNVSDMTILEITDGGYQCLSVMILSTDYIRIKHGTSYLTAANLVLSANTNYYVWVRYVASTGVDDGIYQMWVGTTGIFANATLQVDGIDGARTNTVTQINPAIITDIMTTPVIFDNIKVATAQVGDL